MGLLNFARINPEMDNSEPNEKDGSVNQNWAKKWKNTKMTAKKDHFFILNLTVLFSSFQIFVFCN